MPESLSLKHCLRALRDSIGNCLPSCAHGGDARPRSRRRRKTHASEEAQPSPLPTIPREEFLHLVPGRIFSNDGRSGCAAIYTRQGQKGINQDAMLLWEEFGGAGAGDVFCGVFDGHGPFGHLVARKVRDALPLKLISTLPKQARRRGLAAAGHLSVPNWREVFVKAYKSMDKELRSYSTLDCFCSGSTAVTVLKLGCNLYMGNIGDSRAVLGSKADGGGAMVAVQLTVDLKPDLPKEAARIKKCKGRVFALQDEPEVQRVWLPFDDAPGLAMARAFGDCCLKNYGVISEPEFFHRKLTNQDQFIILASDGIWDVLSNKEAVDIVALSPSRSAAARHLVEAAACQWATKYPTSKMDDCAVVCLFLDGTTDPANESPDISSVAADDDHSSESLALESDAGQNPEPTLVRNDTVRSNIGNTRVQVSAGAEHRANGAAEGQNWSSVEGMTRANSLTQIPRFPEERPAA